VVVTSGWGDSLMDLSAGGDQDAVRHAVLDAGKILVGTVPVY